MSSARKIDLIVKVLPAVITLVTVLVGVWQFNQGQQALKEREIEQRNFEIEKMNSQASIETLTKFKDIQHKLYSETTSIISYLTVNDDHKSEKYRIMLNRFWQLYWVELSAVETEEVEHAMVNFGHVLEALEETNYKDLEERKAELKSAGYQVAQAIKNSARSWELPRQLKDIKN